MVVGNHALRPQPDGAGVLYTALTRARKLLVMVGDDAAVRSMAANDKQQKRYSGLKWRLCHAGENG